MPQSRFNKHDLVGLALQDFLTKTGQGISAGIGQAQQRGILQNLLGSSNPMLSEPNVQGLSQLTPENLNLITLLANQRLQQEAASRSKRSVHEGVPGQFLEAEDDPVTGKISMRELNAAPPSKPVPRLLRTETVQRNGVTKMVDVYGTDEGGKETITERKFQDFTPNAITGDSTTSNLDLLTGDEILESLPKGERSLIQSILDYRVDPARVTSLRRGERKKIMEYVTAVDPTFDMTQYNARYKTRQDFTSGKAANNIRSLNTAVGHLGTLAKAAEELQNAGSPVWNSISNFGLSQVGDPRVKKFLVAANAVESELASVFKGMGATDQEIKAWREALSSSDSPEQLKATIEQAIQLLGSRLGALSSQFEIGTGKPKDFKILNDESRRVLQGLGIDVNQLDPTPNAEGAGELKPTHIYDPEKGLVPVQ